MRFLCFIRPESGGLLNTEVPNKSNKGRYLCMKITITAAAKALKPVYHCLIVLGDAIAVFHALGFLAVGCATALHLVGVF
jgi:hypothetical protein